MQFWLSVGLIAVVVSNIVAIVIGLANRKQRREVSFTETPASKREFDQHVSETHDNFVQVRSELKADRHENQIHASSRSSALYQKVEDVRKELDNKLTETRAELASKIDDMPERVIATLKNTGAI